MYDNFYVTNMEYIMHKVQDWDTFGYLPRHYFHSYITVISVD